MKPVSPELLTLLATREFALADLFTFTFVDGSVVRYTSAPIDIKANGFTYSAGGQVGPYFDRQSNKALGHQILGLQADQLTFDVIPGTATIFGATFTDSVKAGVFDGAEILVERCFMPIDSYGDTRRGTVRWFMGRVATVNIGRSVCTFVINSHVELLNQQMPRNLYQAACPFNLGDASCGVNPIPSTTGSVLSGSSLESLNVTIGGAFGAGTFDLGVIRFTSGALSGLTYTVRSCAFGSPTVIVVYGILPAVPGVGDSFVLQYGCDKSLGGNGCPKFNNVPRFGGFPYVPQPDTAV